MGNDFNYIFNRRHSLLLENRRIFERNAAAYAGGENYISLALVRHMSEIEPEFVERCRRAYYFNYPRKLARLITQYSLAGDPERPKAPGDIVEDFSRSGLRANEVMRQFSTLLNIYGLAWLLVEMPALDEEENPDFRQCRPYALALPPMAVPDWAFDRDGRLSWAIVEEQNINKLDPYREAVPTVRRRLWTRKNWQLFERNLITGQVECVGFGEHNLNAVPLVMGQEADGVGIAGSHWFEDVVRISDAILNNESEAQMNIVKQMFGLLVIPESFARSARPVNSAGSFSDDKAPPKFSHLLARSAAVWESNEERGISRYISPSGSDTAQIREENFYLKRELYDVVGMAIQRENAVAQTAESKAWDYQNIRQFLTCRVDLIEQCENQVWQLMRRWDGAIPDFQVAYSRDFAVVNMRDSVETLLSIKSLASTPAFQREISNTALNMLEKIRRLSPEVRDEIQREISNQATGKTPDFENIAADEVKNV